jgi:hypothetical protein
MEVCNKIAENPILEYFELISAICEREPAVKWARSLEAAKETCKSNPKGLWVKNSEADLVGFYKSELTHAKKYFKLIPEFEWQ